MLFEKGVGLPNTLLPGDWLPSVVQIWAGIGFLCVFKLVAALYLVAAALCGFPLADPADQSISWASLQGKVSAGGWFGVLSQLSADFFWWSLCPSLSWVFVDERDWAAFHANPAASDSYPHTCTPLVSPDAFSSSLFLARRSIKPSGRGSLCTHARVTILYHWIILLINLLVPKKWFQ